MLQIENQFISATFNEKGAELTSLILKENKTNYLWSGNPEFWGKYSPILFPIVGGLKDNKYSYNGFDYQMNRHGFARESTFTILVHKENQIIFELKSNALTLKQYPFEFSLQIAYTIKDNRLEIAYDVVNNTNGEMYFSIGAHPAFAVPFPGTDKFEDCSILFNKQETAAVYPLDANGQIIATPIPFLNDAHIIPLKKTLFYNDALIFTDLQSNSLQISSKKSEHGLMVQFDNFPYLGIWSAKDADFVCIEPWCGLADFENATGNLKDKKGIIRLDTNENWHNMWSITLY